MNDKEQFSHIEYLNILDFEHARRLFSRNLLNSFSFDFGPIDRTSNCIDPKKIDFSRPGLSIDDPLRIEYVTRSVDHRLTDQLNIQFKVSAGSLDSLKELQERYAMVARDFTTVSYSVGYDLAVSSNPSIANMNPADLFTCSDCGVISSIPQNQLCSDCSHVLHNNSEFADLLDKIESLTEENSYIHRLNDDLAKNQKELTEKFDRLSQEATRINNVNQELAEENIKLQDRNTVLSRRIDFVYNKTLHLICSKFEEIEAFSGVLKSLSSEDKQHSDADIRKDIKIELDKRETDRRGKPWGAS